MPPKAALSPTIPSLPALARTAHIQLQVPHLHRSRAVQVPPVIFNAHDGTSAVLAGRRQHAAGAAHGRAAAAWMLLRQTKQLVIGTASTLEGSL